MIKTKYNLNIRKNRSIIITLVHIKSIRIYLYDIKYKYEFLLYIRMSQTMLYNYVKYTLSKCMHVFM